MSDPRRAQHVATRVHEDLGPVTLLVNNAGMQIEKTVVDTADDDWERLVGVNCRGVFTMCRAVLPTMTVHGGVILNIGSISGVVADPGMALYKAFITGRCLTVDGGMTAASPLRPALF